MPPKQIPERVLLLILGAVQFVNVLDFMMVMPMGPDFAAALDIPMSHLGWIGGAYTAAAAVSGLISSLFLDRYDRRKALGVAVLGLVIATALGGFAHGLPSLLLARVAAGAFGGPAASLTLAIVADQIPPERRGRAIGALMGAFSVASVVGVPAGLELARLGGWRMPFFAVSGVGAVVAAVSLLYLPAMRPHAAGGARVAGVGSYLRLLARREAQLAFGAMAVATISGFALIPNIPAYVQFNGGYPRRQLGVLYFAGGLVSFVTMRIAGQIADRRSAVAAAWIGTILFAVAAAVGFLAGHPLAPVLPIFIVFMVGMSFRGVPLSAVASRVPDPAERARYMSLQSTVQHMSAALGSFLSARLLTEGADHRLLGMPRLAALGIVVSLAFAPLVGGAERIVRSRTRA